MACTDKSIRHLLVIFLVSVACCQSVDFPQIPLPLVSFNGLATHDPTTIVSATHALTTLGALQITDIPHFAELRQAALSPLGACLKGSLSPDSITQNMPDGSFRLTSVASSSRGVAGPMTSNCGDSAARLRTTVDAATKELFGALDRTRPYTKRGEMSSKADVMSPYASFEDVLRNGEHLEHLHTYFSPTADEVTSEKTFEYHTDAGLFIAMTTGLYSGEAPFEASGLYVELPSGVRAKAVLRDDALVILVGDGGARWLQSSSVVGSPLRAVPHALVAGLRPGSQSTRSWYGKMFLPPGDAVVPAAAGEEQQQVTFEQYQQRHSRAVAAARAEGRNSVPVAQTLPTACGRNTVSSGSSSYRHLSVSGVRHRYYHTLSTATECTTNGEAGIMCWMRCMSVEDLSCGQSAECVDPATGQVVDGDTVTCPSCTPQCPTAATGTETATMGGDSSNDYCYGTGVTMFMEGFTSIAYEPKGSVSCINLLFLHWTLDSKLKFGFACVGVMLFGIFVQFLTKLRHILSQRKVSLENNAMIVAVHGVQIVSGYFAMLVAMTYSIELFCMICAGLTVGFAIFNVKTPMSESVDPCCPPEAEDSESLVANPIKTSSATHVPAPDL